MIDLTELQALDPALFLKIAQGLPIQPCSQYIVQTPEGPKAERYKEGWIPLGELMPEAAEAWIQACIQDACQSRGWDWQIRTFYGDPLYFIAYVIGDGHEDEGQADTATKAISKAYCQALQAEVPK